VLVLRSKGETQQDAADGEKYPDKEAPLKLSERFLLVVSLVALAGAVAVILVVVL
jgi:hypothetical protein